MPLLLLKDGTPVNVPDALVEQALASGEYQQPGADASVTVINPVTGLPGDVAAGDLETTGDVFGTREETEGEFRERERQTRIEREHGGIGGAIGTAVETAADTASFGLYGAGTDLLFGDDYTEDRRERQEANPLAAGIGTVAGAVAPAALSGGTGAVGGLARAMPSGAAARVAERIAARGAGKGIAAKTAHAAAGYGVEGALFGAGHVLSETVLHEKDLSAEAFIAGAQQGALWGGLTGGAGSLLSSGTRAAKTKYDKFIDTKASVAELEQIAKQAQKDLVREQRLADRLRIEQEKHLNRAAMEELKTKGKLDIVDAREAAKRESVEFTTEQKLKLEEYRLEGKKELTETAAEARLRIEQEKAGARIAVEQERQAGRLAVADKSLEKEAAKAEARAAVARAKLEQASERLAIEQERTARAQLVMEGRQQLADTYTAGWKRAADSREAVAASKLEATGVRADAKIRTDLADSLVRSGRDDAGMLVEELIPAKMRTPKAVEAAKSKAVTEASRLVSTTEELIRQADELIAMTPGAAPEIAAAREAAAQAAPRTTAWAEKASAGADDFADGFTTLRQAEQAQHDLAQAMRPHMDPVGQQSIDQVLAGMDEAVGKTDDIVVDAIARKSEAATGGTSSTPGRVVAEGSADTAAIADLMLQAGGLPNADDIPAIGPVLGAYLKFRAARGALNHLGIRLPGPVAHIAQVGAGVQNRASQVIAAAIQRAPMVAKKIEQVAPPTVQASLSRPLWAPPDDDDEQPRRRRKAEDKKESSQELYQKRAAELERATQDPEGTRRRIARSVPAPPTVATAIADTAMRKLDYLAMAMPKDPRPPILRTSPYRPSPVELQQFAEKQYAVDRPVEAIGHILSGRMSPPAAEAVRAVYPRLFQQMQDELIEQVAEAEAPPPYAKLARASLIFDLPLDQTLVPSYSAARQAEYAQEAQAEAQVAPRPSGGTLRLSEGHQTGAQRRAMR